MLNLLRLGSPSSESSNLVITYVLNASTGLQGALRAKPIVRDLWKINTVPGQVLMFLGCVLMDLFSL